LVAKRKVINKIVILVFGIGFVYVGYRLCKAYKNIVVEKETIGYKMPSKGLQNPAFKSEKWKGILIDTDITYTDGAHNIVPYDLDNDGEVELIANSYRSDALILYKYNSDPHDSSNWLRYVIDSSVGGGIPRKPIEKFVKSTIKEKVLGGYTGGAHYTAIADMNRDGRDDLIVAGDLKRYDVVWYEAPKDITKVSEWKKHVIYKNDTHRTYHVETGDIDGDGDQDVVFATKTDNSIGWLENKGSVSTWPVVLLDANCLRCFNVRAADINKDGKDEIIASEDDSKKGGKLHLYIHSGNPYARENWKEYNIASFSMDHGVSVFEIIDMDKDGDLDIVTGNHQGDVWVLENPYPQKVLREWKKFEITASAFGSGHEFREIDVGDIDNDGDYDIIVADEVQNMIIWFENPRAAFSENWAPHIIDKSKQYLKWCHFVELGDIDHDGDLDVSVAAAGSNVFLLYFNNINMKDINQ